MIKVITYGTFDLLHYGHIRLLERAKSLGDHLIVGITADDYDKTRGKVNVQQSLAERIEGIRSTRLADEIIIEEYEGQKIDDIIKYEVDIFTVGSDWAGKFDYLKEFCEVIYLDRTQGISSTEIRTEKNEIKIGIVGESVILEKFLAECKYVNGAKVNAVYSLCRDELPETIKSIEHITDSYDELLKYVDAVYIMSSPHLHYEHTQKALLKGKNVICETPIALKRGECKYLYELADKMDLILVEGNKTAYSTAYTRLLLLLKTGKIGKVLSVDATCTSLSGQYFSDKLDEHQRWNSIEAWGAKSLLPVFQILGTGFKKKSIISLIVDEYQMFDLFTKIDFVYPHSVASIKVGKGVKAEGELVISGTKGYVYVPAPWWKTDYFELRYENPANNKRYFYQLDGEGIRYEIIAFIKAIENGKKRDFIDRDISIAIAGIMEDYYNNIDVTLI